MKKIKPKALTALLHTLTIPVVGALLLLPDFGRNLEYEYVTAFAWLTLVGLPVLNCWIGDPLLREPLKPGSLAILVTLRPGLSLLPGIILFLTGICPCNETGFLFWMGVQWYPTWVLALALSAWLLRIRRSGLSPLVTSLFGPAIIAVGVAWVAITLWFNPQKRIVSLLAGFLHGPIYDNWIPVDAAILQARLAHLIFALSFLIFVVGRSRRQLITALFLLVTAGAIILPVNDAPSTVNTTSGLQRQFTGLIKEETFAIHYVAATEDKDVPLRIKRLHRDTLFHRAELAKIFGDDIPYFHVYVYPDKNAKKLWFGGDTTDITDVRTPSIHILDRPWPHPTLRHELVHAMGAGIAFHGLGFHPNMAFTEGLAVALAPRFRSLPLDESAAAILRSGRIESVRHLFSPLFWREAGPRAYTVAGSFVQYLIEQKGVKKVRELYSGGDWAEIMGEGESSLVNAWRKKILGTSDGKRTEMQAEALFRYPGVWRARCPHSRATLLRSTVEDPLLHLRQPPGWNRSRYQNWSIALDEGFPGPKLKAWRDEIKSLVKAGGDFQGRLHTWIRLVSNIRVSPPATMGDVASAIFEADLRRMTGEVQAGMTILKELYQLSAEKSLGNQYLRQIFARLSLENDLKPAEIQPWRLYLAGLGEMPDKAPEDFPWMILYLQVRRGGRYLPALEVLQRELHEPVPRTLPDTFVVEWYRFLGWRFMQKGRFSLAARSFGKAARIAGAGKKALLLEHQRRARFYQQTGPF